MIESLTGIRIQHKSAWISLCVNVFEKNASISSSSARGNSWEDSGLYSSLANVSKRRKSLNSNQFFFPREEKKKKQKNTQSKTCLVSNPVRVRVWVNTFSKINIIHLVNSFFGNNCICVLIKLDPKGIMLI